MAGTVMEAEEFSYGGAVYVKDTDGSVKGTPLWNLAFDPDCAVTVIRPCGFEIKIKNFFIKESDDCTIFLYGKKVFVKIVITDGEIAEYESLPKPARLPVASGKENRAAIAWLYKHGQNKELHFIREEDLCW